MNPIHHITIQTLDVSYGTQIPLHSHPLYPLPRNPRQNEFVPAPTNLFQMRLMTDFNGYTQTYCRETYTCCWGMSANAVHFLHGYQLIACYNGLGFGEIRMFGSCVRGGYAIPGGRYPHVS